jgi:hypothetical protein
MSIIKLKDLLHEQKLIEAPVADLPPVKFVMPPAQHAYAQPASNAAGKPYTQPDIDFSGTAKAEDVASKAANVIIKFENSKDNPKGGYNKQLKRWFPHKSLEGGSDTIAYGHKIQPGENFSKGLTDDEAVKLLNRDINRTIDTAKRFMKNFDSFPLTIKIAIINAGFRGFGKKGDLGPETMKLLSQHKFADAAKEYLNHREYRTTSNQGVKKRMNWNASVFKSGG